VGNGNETAIDASTGVLTIAANEPHATVFTVKATSTVDTNKSGTAQVTAVSVMPSALYGTWFKGGTKYDIIDDITTNRFRRDDTDGDYHEKALTSWAVAVGSGDNTYPVGYKVTGTQTATKNYTFANDITFFLRNDGGAYLYKNGDGNLEPSVFTKQP
jgi:hypothetical protein